MYDTSILAARYRSFFHTRVGVLREYDDGGLR